MVVANDRLNINPAMWLRQLYSPTGLLIGLILIDFPVGLLDMLDWDCSICQRAPWWDCLIVVKYPGLNHCSQL